MKITPAYDESSEEKHVDEMILTGGDALRLYLGCYTAINQLLKVCRRDGARFYFFPPLLAALSAFVGELLTNSEVLNHHFILTF